MEKTIDTINLVINNYRFYAFYHRIHYKLHLFTHTVHIITTLRIGVLVPAITYFDVPFDIQNNGPA